MDTSPEHEDFDPIGHEKFLLEIPPGTTRRLLLVAAVAGFASASVLLPPAWRVTEVSASGHPAQGLQGRNDRRRRKKRNERDRKSRQGHRKKDKKHDAPQLGPKGIKLTVENTTTTNFQIKCWLGTFGWEAQECDLPSQGIFFAGADDLHVGIEFLTERNPFVWVENPVAGTPNATFQYGGTMHFAGYFGGTVDVNHGVLEEEAETAHSIPFTSTRNFGIKVRRERDRPGFKDFKMTVTES